MQNIIKRIVWVCLAIIPFLALYVAGGGTFDLLSASDAGMYFPFISGKNLVFRFLVEIAFAGWVILALEDSFYRINIKKNPLIIAGLVFLFILFVADIFGVDRFRSIWSNYERMEGFVGLAHVIAYFFVLTVTVRSVKDWQKMFKLFLASDILVVLYSYAQLLGAKGYIFAEKFPSMAAWFSERFPIHQSENRLDATIGNSAYYAIFCLMSAFIAAILWSQDGNAKRNWYYPLIIVLNLVGIFYSGTRGTLIGLMVGVLLSLGIVAWHEKGYARKVLLGALISVVIGLVLLFSFKNSDFIKSAPTLNRIASISFTDLTTMSRLSIWKISAQAFLEHPVLGYGQDNFSYIYARKFIPEKMWNLEPWYDRSHDVFFDWLVAAGALGLISYLSLYLVAMWLVWKKPHNMPFRERAILTGMIAGYFVHNIFVFDNLTSYILFFATLAYIVVRTEGEEVKHSKREMVSEDQLKMVFAPLIVIALLFTQYYVNYKPYLANSLLIRGMNISGLAQTMPLSEAIKISQDAFVQAVGLHTLGSEEAREQFLQMGVRMSQINIPADAPAATRQATILSINDFIKAVRLDVDNSLETHKEDVRMLSIYGMFFNGIGDAVSGERVLLMAHALAPKKQLISFDLTKAYLLENKYKEAYALAKETYDYAPVYNDALKWYMISAVYAGSFDEANKYISSNGQSVAFDSDVLGAAISTSQTRVAISLLNQAKKEKPEYSSQIDAYIQKVLAGIKN